MNDNNEHNEAQQTTAQNYQAADQAPPPPPPRPIPPPVPPVNTAPYCPLLHWQANNPPPKKRFLRTGCLLLLAVFALAFFFVMGSITLFFQALDQLDFSSGSSMLKSGPRILTETLRPGSGHQCIAVINVNGLITSADLYQAASARRICNELRYAREDEQVAAIIIDMNTPGGEVTASDEILNELRQCRAAGKPVITCMRALGASGGYFVASGSDWIIANRHTFTGSIGVIMSSMNYSELLDKIGVQSEIYRSGDMKDMLTGRRPRSEAEKIYVQELIQQSFLAFAQVVAEGRSQIFPDAEAVMAASFADGRVLTGDSALQAGLIDQLGYFDDAIAKAIELSGATDPSVLSYSQRASVFDLLLSMKLPGSFDLRQLVPHRAPSIESGKPYFLAPECL
jgi:protease-4